MTVRKINEVNLAFPIKFYETIAEALYKPLLLGENSVLLCPPFFGKEYIVKYLSERIEKRKQILGSKFNHFYFTSPIQIGALGQDYLANWIQQFFLSLPRSSQGEYTFTNFEQHLRSVLDEDGLDLVFFTNVLESMNDELFTKFLQLAKRIYFIAPSKIHFVLFIDHRWNDLEFTRIISPFYSLFQHVVRPSERTDNEIEHFTHYRLSVWGHIISKEALDLIVREAGGIPLFAKSAARIATQESVSTLSEVNNIILHHPEYRHRIQIFWESLTELQRNILTDIANGKVPVDPEVEHLVAIGVINKLDSSYAIRSTTLERSINPAQKNKFSTIRKQVKLTSTETKLLKTLCDRPGEVVSRDEIAHILWEEAAENKYSDWAIDQVISRLRRKLESVPAMKLELMAKKKAGVLLRI